MKTNQAQTKDTHVFAFFKRIIGEGFFGETYINKESKSRGKHSRKKK